MPIRLHALAAALALAVAPGSLPAQAPAADVHRSHIVNLDFVRHLVPYDAGRLMVEMRDGTKILASRARSRALRELAL